MQTWKTTDHTFLAECSFLSCTCTLFLSETPTSSTYPAAVNQRISLGTIDSHTYSSYQLKEKRSLHNQYSRSVA
ncbi:hypothetical protein BDA96_06G233000 [Sorghum bicolor]|nr:hypothetical protein BDA96_06G233000 [Sorghum bicolor]